MGDAEPFLTAAARHRSVKSDHPEKPSRYCGSIRDRTNSAHHADVQHHEPTRTDSRTIIVSPLCSSGVPAVVGEQQHGVDAF
jgi:hypothetical protein